MTDELNTNPTPVPEATTPVVVNPPSETTPLGNPMPKQKRTFSRKTAPPKRSLRTSVKAGILIIVLALFGGTGYVATRPSSHAIAPLPTISISPTSGAPSAQIISNGICHATQLNPNDPESWIPDPKCTPGALNLDVTQDTISTTICIHGYTRQIRPPVGYTEPLKIKSIADYGYIDKNPRDLEFDHVVPLETGGNPTDVRNLWAEPGGSPNEKDFVENAVNRFICSKELTLKQGQNIFLNNWYACYLQLKNDPNSICSPQ